MQLPTSSISGVFYSPELKLCSHLKLSPHPLSPPLPLASMNVLSDSMNMTILSSVQLLSCVRLSATPWTAARQASLSITNSRSSPRLMSIESVMPSSHLILCRPLLLLPPIPPSIRVFSNESTLSVRWPKYWSFSFSISPSNEYSVLISFRLDWFDLLAVQGTLKSLLQYHSSKASVLWCFSLLYGSTLTFSHDYWKSRSFDHVDLCWQSDLSAF